MESLSEHDSALIEGKIDGSLNEEELSVFEQKFENSDSFKREFELQSAVVQTIVRSGQEELRQELTEALTEARRTKTKPDSNKSLMMAASVSILVIACITYFWLVEYKINTQDIYLANFEMYPAPPITRGNEVGASLSDFDDYRVGNYTEAIETFESAPQSEMTSIYLAMCYLKTDQTEKAIASIKRSIHSDNPIVSQTAEWYLALAYLKNNNPSGSLDLIQKITSEKQLYHKQASEILEQIGP